MMWFGGMSTAATNIHANQLLNLGFEISWYLETETVRVNYWNDKHRDLSTRKLSAASAALELSCNGQEVLVLDYMTVTSWLCLTHLKCIL